MPYEDFREEFEAKSELTDMKKLVDEVKQTGAQYVILTTKHHDGYTLWPSDLTHPRLGAFGSKRDLVGDFSAAAKDAGLRFGAYYSGGYDWPFNDALLQESADALLAQPADPAYARYTEAHLTEIIDRYQPSILWNDIGWPGGGDLAKVLAHYYNTVPDGLINDRWTTGPAHRSKFERFTMKATGTLISKLWRLIPASMKKVQFPEGPHKDFDTLEYSTFSESQAEPWEFTRGIGQCFALNRNEDPRDFLTAADLVYSLADATSKNGRMLLGLGPDASGKIPEDQLRPARGLGQWLATNGEAIYGTHPYSRAEGSQADVRYSVNENNLYAIVFEPPDLDRLRVFGGFGFLFVLVEVGLGLV